MQCSRCGLDKREDEFYKTKTGKSYKRCSECERAVKREQYAAMSDGQRRVRSDSNRDAQRRHAAKMRERYRTDDSYREACLDRNRSYRQSLDWRTKRHRSFRQMLRDARVRAVRKGLPCTLTLDDLESMWDRCCGRCDVSGIEFAMDGPGVVGRKNPYKPSLDRIDPQEGYVRENVRLVLWAVNCGVSDFGLDVYKRVAAAVIKNTTTATDVSCRRESDAHHDRGG